MVVEDTDKQETSRGRIFNSLGGPRKNEEEDTPVAVTEERKPVAASASAKDPKPVEPADEDSDEDWGAVPAFLRRSKLKIGNINI